MAEAKAEQAGDHLESEHVLSIEIPRQLSVHSLDSSIHGGSSQLISARRRRQATRTTSGYEEPFRLHPPGIHIPESLWHPHMLKWDHHGLTLPYPTLQLGATWREACRRASQAIHRPYLPWWGKLKHHRQCVVADAMAGLTAGVMLIPQGMAYAMIASLPPIMGLYTASIAPFVFALLGTSQQLSVGPVSLASIYFPTVLENLRVIPPSPGEDVNELKALAASLVTLYVGGIFLCMGTFKLGSLIRYLSHSVMTGFTTAAGAYVGFSQIKYILDLHPHKQRYHFHEYHWVLTHLHEANPRTVLLGASAFLAMVTVKVLKRRYPSTPSREKRWVFKVLRVLATFSTLLVVVISAAVAPFLDVPVVGKVKPGLSRARVPSFRRFMPLNSVLLESIPVALLAYMEAYAVGRKYAELNRYEIDSNQDLWALGLGNVASSFFGTFVASGSFARTALNAEAGARTPFSNLILGSFILVTLSWLSPWLSTIPMAVLGAVIENAVLNLIDPHEFYRALHLSPLSFCVMLVTFVSTFFISIEDGLLLGVVSSVVLVLYQLSNVDSVPLGIDGDGPGLRFVSMTSHSNAHAPAPHIVVVRPVASLFFGNAHTFRRAFHAIVRGNQMARSVSEDAGVVDEKPGHEHGNPTNMPIPSCKVREGKTVQWMKVDAMTSNGVEKGMEGKRDTGVRPSESAQGEGRVESTDGEGHGDVVSRMENGEAGLAKAEEICSPQRGGEAEGRRGMAQVDKGVAEKGIGPGRNGAKRVEYILVDCCAIKVLDLTAMGALAEVVDDCQCHHVTVLFSNCSHGLKKSLQACELLTGLGGDLTTLSTEEVYALIIASEEYCGAKASCRGAEQRSVASSVSPAIMTSPERLRPFHHQAKMRKFSF